MKALIKQVGNSQKKEWSGLWQIILIVVGVVVIVGLIVSFRYDPELAKFAAYLIGGALLLWQVMASSQRAKAAEETASAMQKTADSTEKGNIAERFKNAIEHLGHESPSVRMGGIYALHHIAQDVKEYRERVFEILCAHIRETTTQSGYKPPNIQIGKRNSGVLSEPSIEIQSILKVLFTDSPERDIYAEFTANLEHSYLTGAILGSTNLQDANFFNADLNHVIFIKSELQRANFEEAVLQDANFRNANLNSAAFINAELQGTYFEEANLQNANFHNANLNKALFIYAELQGSHFEEADLQGANFFSANLQGTYFEWANLQHAVFLNANSQDVHFEGADLQRANFEGADLQNANFLFANLQEANLSGTKNLTTEQLLTAKTLYQAKLSDGTGAEIDQSHPWLFYKPKPDNETDT